MQTKSKHLSFLKQVSKNERSFPMKKKHFTMEGPDQKSTPGQVKGLKTAVLTAGKKPKIFEGPDLSGGGWVRKGK